MALREPNKKELKVIKKALSYFDSKSFLEKYSVFVKEGEDRKELFALSKDLAEFLKKLDPDIIYNAGIKVGEVGRRLRLSLEGSFWLVRKDKKKVWVNERGEMLFLYGRDIFSSSVIKAGDFGENEVVFVSNKHGDIIGIGKSRFPAEKIWDVDPDRVVIENLTDRGEYIRHVRLYESF
ncbi:MULTISPECIES: PUA domain-containing protein [unclassified Archaeoglobus]|jgi:60S ribosome subunit biogenesis protein NIP7|uniref:PUA domain-containing protein n=1 Tax=unclassified Archaeoglobus TaxID=2643606 RepID=UPI0025B92AEF|nr:MULTISPECIES: NIP7 N-terminal domain-related protein [unclassified Archaeoglobus]